MKRYGFVLAWVVVAACGPTPHHGPGGDVTTDAPPTGGDSDAAICGAESATATEVTRPVDIIWVIDNSGSMSEEEARVQNNMNTFASSIASSGVDYHVIVIADTSHITVPAPLGGSPQFLGLNINIDSHNALQKLVESYPMYQAFLRPTSVKHIVVVSDDESGWSQAMAESSIAALTGPGFGTDWRLHAIVAEAPPYDFNSHCFTLSAAVGSIYIHLQQAHMGQFYSLCDTNWSPLFTALAQSVTQGLALPCTYALPTPPNGQTLDPTKVNFVYTPTGGAPMTIVNVGSAAGCNGGPGWYYDDPANPMQIIVCPTTCTALQHDATGQVSVEFGCGTVFQ
jgi:hypothetical protein